MSKHNACLFLPSAGRDKQDRVECSWFTQSLSHGGTRLWLNAKVMSSLDFEQVTGARGHAQKRPPSEESRELHMWLHSTTCFAVSWDRKWSLCKARTSTHRLPGWHTELFVEERCLSGQVMASTYKTQSENYDECGGVTCRRAVTNKICAFQRQRHRCWCSSIRAATTVRGWNLRKEKINPNKQKSCNTERNQRGKKNVAKLTLWLKKQRWFSNIMAMIKIIHTFMVFRRVVFRNWPKLFVDWKVLQT